MENLALQSIKELKELASEKGIKLPRRAKKEEILSLISEVIEKETSEVVENAENVEETPKEEFSWEKSQISRRSLSKLDKETLLTYKGFPVDDLEAMKAFDSLDEKDIIGLILKHKKENSKEMLEKNNNLADIIALIVKFTEENTKKLTLEEIAIIRKEMQGRSFTKEARTQIRELLDSVKVKVHSKFEIEEFRDYLNAERNGDSVLYDEGEEVVSMPYYEFMIRTSIRDFGEAMAYDLKALIDNKVSSLSLQTKRNKYEELTYDILLDVKDKEEQHRVISEIIQAYDQVGFPLEFNMLSIDNSIKPGAEISLKDVAGKIKLCRVIQQNPLMVQMFGDYFIGASTLIDKNYFSFDRVTIEKPQEVFNKYASAEYMENTYDAELDPAITPSILEGNV